MKLQKDKQHSYLDQFCILKTLGAGYHAQVKLAKDEDGKLYAIKRYKKQTASLSTLQHQLNIMKQLQHQNLVQLIDVRENATYRSKNSGKYQCFAIIIQYAPGGELFDFVAETGKFSQKITRTYFHQMMNGLHFMHAKGFAHRDIKPENLLLGKDYILKLADFGFSCPLKGKDKSGILHTKLGTQGYMAPEVYKKNYVGTKADIFSAGVILFIMYAGNPPFQKTDGTDPYFQLIMNKNFSLFWKVHLRKRPQNYFSESFKDLFENMVAYNPDERLTIEEIAVHPWVKLSVCTKSEINEEFQKRQKVLDEILEEKRLEQEKKRLQKIRKTISGIQTRGDEDFSLFVQLYEDEEDVDRQLPQLCTRSTDDLILKENKVFGVANLQEYLKTAEIPTSQEKEEERNLLNLKNIKDEGETLTITFEYQIGLELRRYTNELEFKIRLGTDSLGRLIMNFELEKGNRFYFKKVIKQLNKLFAYCKV